MISGVVLTFNEEKDIKNCLESIKFLDEIIVIDNHSSDTTLEIVKNYTDRIFVKKYDDFSKARNFGLEKKGAGVWERPVHETWNIKGKRGYLKNPLQHYAHPNIPEFINKIKIYSEADAKYRFSKGVRTSILQIVFFPIAKFFKNYFWWLGFLDGWRGLVFSALMAYHSFLIRLNLYKMGKISKK